jgi:hypothetical protein
VDALCAFAAHADNRESLFQKVKYILFMPLECRGDSFRR